MDNLFSVKDIFQVGGWTMYVLAFCSILVFTVAIERLYVFYKFRQSSPFSMDINCLNDLPENKKEKIVYANITKISSCLDKNLPILATIGALAPFIGLFGTVLGIIKAFKQLSIHRGAGIDIVGEGIAEALVCTAAGLFVAIISVIFYNFFKTKIKRIIDEFEVEMLNFDR